MPRRFLHSRFDESLVIENMMKNFHQLVGWNETEFRNQINVLGDTIMYDRFTLEFEEFYGMEFFLI